MDEVSEVTKVEEEETNEEDKPDKGKTEERRFTVVAQRILQEALVVGDSDETLSRLKNASDKLVSYQQLKKKELD